MQVAPSGGKICNECNRRYLVTKFGTNGVFNLNFPFYWISLHCSWRDSPHSWLDPKFYPQNASNLLELEQKKDEMWTLFRSWTAGVTLCQTTCAKSVTLYWTAGVRETNWAVACSQWNCLIHLQTRPLFVRETRDAFGDLTWKKCKT